MGGWGRERGASLCEGAASPAAEHARPAASSAASPRLEKRPGRRAASAGRNRTPGAELKAGALQSPLRFSPQLLQVSAARRGIVGKDNGCVIRGCAAVRRGGEGDGGVGGGGRDRYRLSYWCLMETRNHKKWLHMESIRECDRLLPTSVRQRRHLSSAGLRLWA